MIITGLKRRTSFRICLQIQADNLPFFSFPDLVIETSSQNEKSLSKDQINHFILTTEPVWRQICEKSEDRTLLSSTVDVRGGWTMYLLADSLLLLFIWGNIFLISSIDSVRVVKAQVITAPEKCRSIHSDVVSKNRIR